jgi:cephalosporin hydroxylase
LAGSSIRKKSDIRSPVSSIPASSLTTIQKGTMTYSWRGIACNKNPFDFALYPMLIWREKPATIIEIGTKDGGSALWLADTCQALGIEIKLISIDIRQRTKVRHPTIEFLQGDGRKLENTLSEKFMARLRRPWLVIEDADHSHATTLAVLQFFHPLMQPGEYILIEDGIVDSFENRSDFSCFNGGPNRAVAEFLAKFPHDYALDTEYCDFFGYNATWNTNGYIKRIAG